MALTSIFSLFLSLSLSVSFSLCLTQTHTHTHTHTHTLIHGYHGSDILQPLNSWLIYNSLSSLWEIWVLWGQMSYLVLVIWA